MNARGGGRGRRRLENLLAPSSPASPEKKYEGGGEDAVAAYLEEVQPRARRRDMCRPARTSRSRVRRWPRCLNDQAVVVEEERLLGDEPRVRLSAPCVGWVSRKCLAVTEDLLNERKLRTLVCVSGDDLKLFEGLAAVYREVAQRKRELHVGFYDDEAYTYLLKLQDDESLNVVLHDTVIFPNVYESKEAKRRKAAHLPVGLPVRARVTKSFLPVWTSNFTSNGESTGIATPSFPRRSWLMSQVYSSLEAFWIRDPLPNLLEHSRRRPPMLEDVRPQGRPCLMFSLDYGRSTRGEKNVELCTGFCCVFN